MNWQIECSRNCHSDNEAEKVKSDKLKERELFHSCLYRQQVMVSEKFRHQLRQEVEQWRSEGLIEERFYEHLVERYQLSTLDTAARNRFIFILLGLGGILLGLAVITFVAANWQVWSRDLKVILLVSLFVSVNAAGFYLWRRPTEGWQTRVGQALLLLGALILGANLALMSQMFHQSGEIYELFLIWGLGVLTMAYGLELTLLGVLALILVALGYCFSAPDLYYLGRDDSSFLGVLQHLPLIAGALFVPLAYRCRSRWLFALSALLVVASWEANTLFLTVRLFDDRVAIAPLVAAFACTLVPALLWAYRDSIWERTYARFDPISRGLAVTALSLLFYILSFRGLWRGLQGQEAFVPKTADIPLYAGSPLLSVLVLLGLTLYAWWKLGYRRGEFWRIDLSSTVVGAMLLATGMLVWWNGRVEPLGAIAIFAFNILLFFLAIGLVRESLGTGQRKGFWLGIVLMVLQLTSRMLEYNTGLLFKAIVLFLCGVAIIAAGLWFERYIRTLPDGGDGRTSRRDDRELQIIEDS
ncbi:MAG: DUF2157 domain-containing protein [Cyanobacteriota bacterium]|nr:DUF2157 domain-containing protein [Cyanobacteriota bacterium]